MMHEDALRAQLAELMTSGHAHVNLFEVLESVPPAVAGRTPPGAPHTPWQLLEHIRIAQWDILEFTRNPSHVSPSWPEGYWPTESAPATPRAWRESVGRVRADLEAMAALVKDPATDLFSPIPHGQGQTVLREALLVADHNAYHLGQLVLLVKQLGAWREEE